MHLSAFLSPPVLCAKHHPRGYYSNPPGQPTLSFVVTCRDLMHRTKPAGPCLFTALLWIITSKNASGYALHIDTFLKRSCIWSQDKFQSAKLKGIIHPKMKICWKCTQPQAIQNVDDFVFSSEQIWRNLTLHHFITNGSSVNGCRQNESPNSFNFKLFLAKIKCSIAFFIEKVILS